MKKCKNQTCTSTSEGIFCSGYCFEEWFQGGKDEQFNMKKKIEFWRDRHYGKEYFYIKDEKLAASVRCLTGKPTVDASDLLALKDLGFEPIEVLSPARRDFLAA